MSASVGNVYRFAGPAHWARTAMQGFRVATGGGIEPIPHLGNRPVVEGRAGRFDAIAVDPFGTVHRRVHRDGRTWIERRGDVCLDHEPAAIDGALATSSRWIADGLGVWAIEPAGAGVRRCARESLESEFVAEPAEGTVVLDLAADGHDGVWALAQDAREHVLLRLDRRGCVTRRLVVPCEVPRPTRIGCTGRGAWIMVLADRGTLVVTIEVASGRVASTQPVAIWDPCTTARLLASDPRGGTVLWGVSTATDPPSGALFVLDASGARIEGPLALALRKNERVFDLAVRGDSVWLATDRRCLRLDATEEAGAREAEALLVTPRLWSPVSDTRRGWLQAEIAIDLPAGAVLDVSFASTDDPESMQAATAASNGAADLPQRWTKIVDAVTPIDRPAPSDARRHFNVVGPCSRETPVVVPLFDSADRWLWVGLDLHVPAGSGPCALHELRVFYPDDSLMEHLPATFRGPTGDPTGLVRTFVGVLEATTRDLDRRIAGIGADFHPATATSEGLDFVSTWLGVPWDRSLPLAARRRILQQSGALLAERGTRAGLLRLLRSLVGDAGSVEVVDVLVDQPPVRLGRARAGAVLPGVLAGPPPRAAVLNTRAVLGRMCFGETCDPRATLTPTVRVELAADGATQRGLMPVLAGLLAREVPAGMRVRIHWRRDPGLRSAADDDALLVVDAPGPGLLGRSSDLGRITLAGRSAVELEDVGLPLGFRLR